MPSGVQKVTYDTGLVTYTIEISQTAFATISWPQGSGDVVVSFKPGHHISVDGQVTFDDPGVVGYWAASIGRDYSQIIQAYFDGKKSSSPFSPFNLHPSIEGKAHVATIDHLDIETSVKSHGMRPVLEATVSSSFQVPGPDGKPITATYGVTLTSEFSVKVDRAPKDLVEILAAAIVVVGVGGRARSLKNVPLRVRAGFAG